MKGQTGLVRRVAKEVGVDYEIAGGRHVLKHGINPAELDERLSRAVDVE